MSLEALKKNPAAVECSEADCNYLERIILPWAKSNLPKAKQETRELLKTKFLPMNLRSRLWKRFVENPGNITKKTYIAYRDLVQKQTAANPSYASSSIIEQNVNSSIKLLIIEPANQQTEIKDSVTRLLLVFEYFQPDVGYVIGTEKLAYFLRRLMDEETCFIIFYNIYFTSEFLWGLLTNDHECISKYINVLQKIVHKYSKYKEMYSVNKSHLERFFAEYSLQLFIGLFSPDLIE